MAIKANRLTDNGWIVKRQRTFLICHVPGDKMPDDDGDESLSHEMMQTGDVNPAELSRFVSFRAHDNDLVM